MTITYAYTGSAHAQVDLLDITVPDHLDAAPEFVIFGEDEEGFVTTRTGRHPDLTEWFKARVAQLRYSADTHHWSLYWADRNGRWHRYGDLEPGPVDNLPCEIDADPTCIFWG